LGDAVPVVEDGEIVVAADAVLKAIHRY